MKKCDNCKRKFQLKDGLKSYINHNIKCEKCGTVYKKYEITKWRTIYNALIISIGVSIYLNVVSEITISSLAIYFGIISIPWVLYDILPHNLHKYKLLK